MGDLINKASYHDQAASNSPKAAMLNWPSDKNRIKKNHLRKINIQLMVLPLIQP
jgi:hypothetical protein